MRLQDELRRLDGVEELFALFGLAFDDRVLRIHRLHVMQRFGRSVAEIDGLDPPLSECELWERYCAALKSAHDYYLNGPPLGVHDFSGVQRGLVSLTLSRKG
jgi:hypothetical protein